MGGHAFHRAPSRAAPPTTSDPMRRLLDAHIGHSTIVDWPQRSVRCFTCNSFERLGPVPPAVWPPEPRAEGATS